MDERFPGRLVTIETARCQLVVVELYKRLFSGFAHEGFSRRRFIILNAASRFYLHTGCRSIVRETKNAPGCYQPGA
jgi:hypothetical protein